MTPEKQRIAILEFMGWKRMPEYDYVLFHPSHRAGETMEMMGKDGDIRAVEELLDPINDLNAMHEAVTLLSVDKRVVFYGHLYSILCKSFTGDSTEDSLAFALVNATAAQRAEALLRTIGKWEEGT